MNSNIPVAEPIISKDDILAVTKAVGSGWISVNSPQVAMFEEKFVRVVMKERGYGVAANSGTSALHLALVALGIGAGDEVLVPDLVMIAVPNTVTYVGAKPVLIDCDKQSLNMDLDLVERAVTSKTKAMVVVHTYGVPSEMERIVEICKKHDLRLIEDAAEAIGSEYQCRQLGLFGDASTFSLYANKNITTGEGGIVYTKDEKIYREIKKYRHHYFGENQHFKHDKVGFSYGMTGMQAALGVSQLDRYEQILEKKKQIAKTYRRMLNVSEIEFPKSPENSNYLPWMNGVIFESKSLREKVEDKLEREGIETRRFFLPTHLQKPYRKHKYVWEKSSKSEDFQERGLLLPSGPKISIEEVRRVGRVVFKEIQK